MSSSDPQHPAPPSMTGLSGDSVDTAPTVDETATVASESTDMLSQPLQGTSAFQQQQQQSAPDQGPVAIDNPFVESASSSGGAAQNPSENSTPAEEQTIPAVVPPAVGEQVPNAVILENGATTPAFYGDNNTAPPLPVANGTVTMQPRQAVSALGVSAVRTDQNEGGKQNAFMATAPPPDAFLHAKNDNDVGIINPIASAAEMQIAHVVTPNSLAEEQYNAYMKEQYDVDEDDYDDYNGDPMSPRSLPLGVPDPDDETHNPRDTQHSLPNPEELKVELGVGGAPTSVCVRNLHVPFIAIFGILFLVILGVSIGLTQEARDERKAPTFHGGDERLHHIQTFLATNGISDAAALDDFFSPQYKAADWMAHDDKLEMGIPKFEPFDSDESYDFVTRYVMALLYYTTQGKSWKYELGFLSEKKTCDWYQMFSPPIGQLGVFCNRNSNKIVGFSFSKFGGSVHLRKSYLCLVTHHNFCRLSFSPTVSNNLAGPLPTELSQLTSMTYMESIGNSLSGTIPDDFQRLTSLQTMVLAFNVLTGKIPDWFNRLPKMEFLYLSNNMLTGTIPKTLAQTTALSVLALDDNILSGSINNVWALNNLEYLYLEDNGFTGTMPEFISPLHPFLINLDLSSNKISGPLPTDLFRLERIEIIDLHSNTFVGEIPRDINADQDKLRFLALHQNRFTGSIPPTIGNLHKLTHIDLSNNRLTGRMPIEMEYLTDLTYLFLGANDYRRGKMPSWVYAMTQLKELSLKSTQRTGTISDVIGALDKLVLLDLDNNELTGPIPPDIGFLTNLEFLLLNRNDISSSLPIGMKNMESLSTFIGWIGGPLS